MRMDIKQPVSLSEVKECLCCGVELQKKFVLTCSKACAHSLKKKFGVSQSDIICEIVCKCCDGKIAKPFRKLKSEFCSKSCSSRYFQSDPTFKEKLKAINEARAKVYRFTCPNCFEQFENNKDGRIFCSVRCSSSFHAKPKSKRDEDIKRKIKEGIDLYMNSPESDALRKKRSDNMKGDNNSWYKVDKERIPGIRRKQSESLKCKIASGEFVPGINNRWTSWNAVIVVGEQIKKFRSSWEACVWFCNQHWEYEKVVVDYEDTSGRRRKTIVDFNKDQMLYEVKPKSRQAVEKNKIEAVRIYAMNNGYNYVLIDEDNIMSFVKPELFDQQNIEQLKKLLKGIK